MWRGGISVLAGVVSLAFVLPCLYSASGSGAASTQNGRVERTAAKKHVAEPGSGTPRIWEDRGQLTPRRVYFGAASALSNPLEALPTPPFDHFEPDDKDRLATSPKAFVRDANHVKWTAKFGPEVHSDTVAPRLAWALGFRVVEGYYVGPGKIEGIGPGTDLGREKTAINRDGTFQGGARFKKHDNAFAPLKDDTGADATWDEGRNPGVPPEQLSGLILFDVLVDNWDAQKKNGKIYRAQGPHGPEDWYIEADLGGSFAPKPGRKYVLAEYAKSPNFVKRVSGGTVELNFNGAIPAQARLHRHVPLADAQWFRRQLGRLSNGTIRAAFDAAYATDGLNRAYATGDPDRINAARRHELSAATRDEIEGFVAAVRARIDQFDAMVPSG